MSRLHKDIQSLNAVISKNEELSKLLENQTFVIESDIAAEIKELESESRRIENTIQLTTEEKRQPLPALHYPHFSIGMCWLRLSRQRSRL